MSLSTKGDLPDSPCLLLQRLRSAIFIGVVVKYIRAFKARIVNNHSTIHGMPLSDKIDKGFRSGYSKANSHDLSISTSNLMRRVRLLGITTSCT